MTIIRTRQPGLTRVSPHIGNKRWIVPNRKWPNEVFDYYIDGDAQPGGDGLTPGTAWQGFAEWNALAGVDMADKRVGLKRGTTISAALNTHMIGRAGGDNVTVAGYGAGLNPLIDGSSVDVSWVVDDTFGTSGTHTEANGPDLIEAATANVFADNALIVQVLQVRTGLKAVISTNVTAGGTLTIEHDATITEWQTGDAYRVLNIFRYTIAGQGNQVCFSLLAPPSTSARDKEWFIKTKDMAICEAFNHTYVFNVSSWIRLDDYDPLAGHVYATTCAAPIKLPAVDNWTITDIDMQHGGDAFRATGANNLHINGGHFRLTGGANLYAGAGEGMNIKGPAGLQSTGLIVENVTISECNTYCMEIGRLDGSTFRNMTLYRCYEFAWELWDDNTNATYTNIFQYNTGGGITGQKAEGLITQDLNIFTNYVMVMRKDWYPGGTIGQSIKVEQAAYGGVAYFVNCTIYNDTDNSADANHVAVSNSGGANGMVMQNCINVKVNAANPQLIRHIYGPAKDVRPAIDQLTDNNLFYSTGNYTFWYGSQGGGAGLYSNLTDWRTSPDTPDLNSDIGDPLFVDVVSEVPDMRLQPGSPAFLLGDGAWLYAPAKDITGAARNPVNPTAGAYEAAGAAPTWADVYPDYMQLSDPHMESNCSGAWDCSTNIDNSDFEAPATGGDSVGENTCQLPVGTTDYIDDPITGVGYVDGLTYWFYLGAWNSKWPKVRLGADGTMIQSESVAPGWVRVVARGAAGVHFEGSNVDTLIVDPLVAYKSGTMAPVWPADRTWLTATGWTTAGGATKLGGKSWDLPDGGSITAANMPASINSGDEFIFLWEDGGSFFDVQLNGGTVVSASVPYTFPYIQVTAGSNNAAGLVITRNGAGSAEIVGPVELVPLVDFDFGETDPPTVVPPATLP